MAAHGVHGGKKRNPRDARGDLIRCDFTPQGGQLIYLTLEEKRSRGLIASWYELKPHLIGQVVGDFIQQMAGQHIA